MNEWAVIFLAIIAVAVSAMAVVQVGIAVYGARLAQRVERLADQVDREIKPLLTNINAVGEEAARAAALASAQVERADRLFADVAQRVEGTAASLQAALLAPAREGLAVVAGLRAAMGAVRDMRRARTPDPGARHEDEDPLFIG